MEDFDFGALDESKLEQAALDFGRSQAMHVFADMNRIDAPAESTICLAEEYAGRS